MFKINKKNISEKKLEIFKIKKIKFKKKNQGISILIAMGTSMMVLGLAFATLNSISKSQEQATNIQVSTQMFYAAESGIEASFFHHNTRGAGVSFPTDTDTEQTINHNAMGDTINHWSISGRTNSSTTGSNTFPLLGDILKENQSIQIPFAWDNTSNTPDDIITKDEPVSTGFHDLKIHFYKNSDYILAPYENAKNYIIDKYGDVSVPDDFDFGDDSESTAGGSVLIDWALSRRNDDGTAGLGVGKGIQTFIPTVNQKCTSAAPSVAGFICEKQLLAAGSGQKLTISTETGSNISGKILPGGVSTTLDKFWKCSGGPTEATPTGSLCKDFRLTFRPLLKFSDTDGNRKIKGIPFIIEMKGANYSFPKPFYSVQSNVISNKYSQKISFDVAERTSIGAFDYVIFD